MALNPPSSVNWRDQVAQRQKELGVTTASAPGVSNPALPRKPDVKFIEPGLINDFSPRPRAPGEPRASPVVRDALYAMTPEGRAYNSGSPAPSAAPAPGAPAAAPKPVDAQMARINAILDDPERKARVEAVAAQGRQQNAAAQAASAAAQPPAAAPSATPTTNYFEGSDGRRRLVNSDGTVTGSAPTSGGVSFVPTPAPAGTPASGTTPTGVTTVASGTGALPRRSALEEFQSIREGIAGPRMYDPTNARLTGRADAFAITDPRSRERELVNLATRVANDPSLKGFAGARNTIIGQIMGQLDAGNAASLEAIQQQGRAGLGMQGFEQDGALQEFGRRGERLRDQFLQEGNERLARLNNDAGMLQTALQGEYGLESARLGASGRNSTDPAMKYSQEMFERYLEQEGATPESAAVAAANEQAASGIDYANTPMGNFGRFAANQALVDANNSDAWIAAGYATMPDEGVATADWGLKPAGFWDEVVDVASWGEPSWVISRPGHEDTQTVGESDFSINPRSLRTAIANERVLRRKQSQE